ncbi:MAG: hypothetical protein R3F19_30380 [Verrucomicrobiales bacterium]
MNISLRRHEITLQPESARVIIRLFAPNDVHRITTIIGRALALTEEEVVEQLSSVHAGFDSRHFDIKSILLSHYEKMKEHIFTHRSLSPERQMLIGALFSGEYALESAALFNPSIVPHPDQTDMPDGALRFIMSLRATGEGHISSIEFRVGTISAQGHIDILPISRFVTVPEIVPDPGYRKRRFLTKLHELELDDDHAVAVLAPLGDRFTRSELDKSLHAIKLETRPHTPSMHRTHECIKWLADSNYELRFSNARDERAHHLSRLHQ